MSVCVRVNQALSRPDSKSAFPPYPRSMFLLSSLSCLVVRYICPISPEYSSSSDVLSRTGAIFRRPSDQALIARLRLDELERNRIHAIAQMSGFGSIVKYVSEMRVTSVAEDLDPPHSVAIVDL